MTLPKPKLVRRGPLSLNAESSDDSFRPAAPSWFAAAAIATACVQGSATEAKADAGAVALRNGGQVRGEIVAVVPNDRVVVVLADGTTMTLPWADVQFVFDGPRVFDAEGHWTFLPAPPEPAAPTTPTSAQTGPSAAAPVAGAMNTTRSLGSDREAYREYLALPSRGGGVALGTFGGLLLSAGIINVSIGSAAGCYGSSYYGGGDDCTFRKSMIASGTLSLGVGALMIGLGVRRLHRRRDGLQRLTERGFLVVGGLDDSLRLHFDLDATTDRVVPRLRLRF